MEGISRREIPLALNIFEIPQQNKLEAEIALTPR
jgi:hypothetical protein